MDRRGHCTKPIPEVQSACPLRLAHSALLPDPSDQDCSIGKLKPSIVNYWTSSASSHLLFSGDRGVSSKSCDWSPLAGHVDIKSNKQSRQAEHKSRLAIFSNTLNYSFITIETLSWTEFFRCDLLAFIPWTMTYQWLIIGPFLSYQDKMTKFVYVLTRWHVNQLAEFVIYHCAKNSFWGVHWEPSCWQLFSFQTRLDSNRGFKRSKFVTRS